MSSNFEKVQRVVNPGAKHKCCPWVLQTWLAFALLIVGAFFMALLQLYPDSLSSYPPECNSLADIGFSIVPHLNDYMGLLADILVLIIIVTFLILTPFVLETPQLAIRRWLILLALLYTFRGIVVIATRYPRLPYKTESYNPSNPLLGALLIMVGAHSTATDIMYSGHTVNFVLAASFVSRYTRYGIFSMFFWLVAIAGLVALVATREHYTADILVGFIVTKLAFWAYHLFFDSLYKRFWVTGLTLENTGPITMAMPLQIRDGFGQKLDIDTDMVAPGQLYLGLDDTTGGWINVVKFAPALDMRNEIYRWFQWFDFE